MHVNCANLIKFKISNNYPLLYQFSFFYLEDENTLIMIPSVLLTYIEIQILPSTRDHIISNQR